MVDFNPRNYRMWSMMGINPSIWSVAFPEVRAKHPEVVALTADLGRYSGMMRTWNANPDRFYNIGIAEQNMVGIASGLAMCGHQVFMTTYAPFMSYRCADQMRHLVGNHSLNIKAIGSAAGLSGGLSGSSLLALGDIAMMRSVPNMIVLSPADCTEAIKMVLACSETDKPVYMRFCGAVNIPAVYKSDYEFKIGKAYELKSGERILIAATGTTLVAEALKAATVIEERMGFSPAVVNFPTIKPLDTDYLESVAGRFERIYTVEEHSVIGGFGSAVCEFAATRNGFPPVHVLGVPDKVPALGHRPYMLEKCGLTVNGIADIIAYEVVGNRESASKR